MTIKNANGTLASISLAGTFVRDTPGFQLTAHTAAQGCGLSEWIVEQNKPLDWPTSNSGDVVFGDVTWAL